MEDFEFYEFIDRLQVCSEINHPSRLWTDQSKIAIEHAWKGKEVELKSRVEELEKEIRGRKEHLRIVKNE